MNVIGITGGFGTGKTFVASIMKRSFGAKVLNADEIAHDVIRKGTPAYKKIVAVFGEEILDDGRNIRRRRLADIAFGNKENLRRLNRIVHPGVIRYIKRAVRQAGKKDVIVIDAPLLVEANLTGMVDKLIVVKAARKAQLERCAKKFCIKERDVLDRIKNQISLAEKIKLADFVVDNNGTKSETRKQVKEIWRKIWK